jgi:hypothetical protein
LSVRKTERERERERELGICFQDQCVLRLLELHVGFTCYGSSAAAVELSNNDGRSRTKHEWTSAQHRPLAPFVCALFSPTASKKRLVVPFPSHDQHYTNGQVHGLWAHNRQVGHSGKRIEPISDHNRFEGGFSGDVASLPFVQSGRAG